MKDQWLQLRIVWIRFKRISDIIDKSLKINENQYKINDKSMNITENQYDTNEHQYKIN